MEIDINESLAKIKELIRNTPLAEVERKSYNQSLQALKQMAAEWQQQKQRIQELEQQLKQ